MSPVRESSTSRSRSARQEEILLAAESCIRELGFAGTTIEAVAERAQLSRATVYRHFDSREALLLELTLQRSRGTLERGIAVMDEAPDMTTALQAAMVYMVSAFPRDPWIRETMHLDPSRALANPSIMLLIRDAFRGFHVRYRARGELRRDLTLDDLVEWITRQAFVIYRNDQADEDEIRSDVERFMLPAIRNVQASSQPTTPGSEGVELQEMSHRIERLEAKIEVLIELLVDSTGDAHRSK